MTHDDLAVRLAAEYELFLFALSGRYQQLRAAGVEITPRAIVELQQDAYALGKTFCDLAKREFDDYVSPLIMAASDELKGALMTRAKHVKVLVRGMVAENVKQVVQQTRTGRHDLTALLKNARGAIGLLVQRLAGKTVFKVTDTSGRRWPAETLMRVVVRDFAYQAYIAYQADHFRRLGLDLVQTNGGQAFSLAGTEGYPSFEAIRADYFHPNSHNFMVPHVPS